jgi:hypothetical protein
MEVRKRVKRAPLNNSLKSMHTKRVAERNPYICSKSTKSVEKTSGKGMIQLVITN